MQLWAVFRILKACALLFTAYNATARSVAREAEMAEWTAVGGGGGGGDTVWCFPLAFLCRHFLGLCLCLSRIGRLAASLACVQSYCPHPVHTPALSCRYFSFSKKISVMISLHCILPWRKFSPPQIHTHTQGDRQAHTLAALTFLFDFLNRNLNTTKQRIRFR